jgi:acyl-CoA reductase-like NAD-dependent aldehyde dehydrogenase
MLSPRGAANECARDDARAFDEALGRALAARGRVLASASNAHLVKVVAHAARQWRSRDFAPRSSVTTRLAEHLAMDGDMLARGLDHLFGAIDEQALEALLAEAEDPAALEHAVVRGGTRERLGGPEVAAYSLAGNVPGLGIFPALASLLARSAAVIRDSARQPWLTEAFVATLAEHDADVAAMVVPVHWAAGDAAREGAVFARAARVEVYGSDATLHAVRTRHAERPAAAIVERGTRLSVGLVTLDAAGDDSADGFAEDIVLYDGLGCLTPHAILVEGGRERATRFAERLAAALAALEARWPRRPRGFAMETARRAFIDASEAQALGAPADRLLRGDADAWVVHASERAPIVLGPGLRCVRVIACDGPTDALERIARAATPLAAVGLAAGARADRPAMARALEALGATLVCEPGRMQGPPLTWRQDGRQRLGDLLAWREART